MPGRGAIVDLDGTVYVGDDLVDGVPVAIRRLRETNHDILFFSNNPVKDAEEYASHLGDFGLEVEPREVLSSGDVTVEYLLDEHPDDRIFIIGADGFREQLVAAGLTVTDDPEACDVLVASWTPEFQYSDLRDALVAVDGETPFYGTDPDRTFPMGEDKPVPGSGAIIGSVAATVGRDPDAILGKPSGIARSRALDRLEAAPEDCLIVGDRLDTDLQMGADAGMETVLVLTGVTDRSDLADAGFEPDHAISSLADIDRVVGDAPR